MVVLVVGVVLVEVGAAILEGFVWLGRPDAVGRVFHLDLDRAVKLDVLRLQRLRHELGAHFLRRLRLGGRGVRLVKVHLTRLANS